MARGKAAGRYSPRREGRDAGGGDDRQRWLTTYADAVTLLLAFFVLLYTMSEMDVNRFEAFVEGLRVPFGNEAGEGLLPESDGLMPENMPSDPLMEQTDQPDQRDGQADHQAEITPEQAAEQAAAHAAQQAQLDDVEQALQQNMEAEGLDQHVSQRREERGLIVTVSADDVLFDTGSTEIGELGRRVIRVVAETLEGFPNPMMIEGHTDDQPLSRDGYTNWNLSTDRAVAVLERMIEEHGLPPERVGAIGYGEHRPLASNDTAAGRAQNRRVDIAVLTEEDQP